MPAWILDTLRRAVRTPSVWGCWALGLVAAWMGVALGVLALGGSEQRTRMLLEATSQGWAVLLALWILARTLEDDRTSSLVPAADALAPGRGGRLLGRWAGAALAAGVGATAIAPLLAPLADGGWPNVLYLLGTNIWSAAQVGAWGLLLVVAARSGVAALLALGLWVAGHLPFGSEALLPGVLGRALAALLPAPLALPIGPTDLLRGGVTVLALLGLALVRAAPVDAPATGGREVRRSG